MSDGQFLGIVVIIVIWSLCLIFHVDWAARSIMAELKRLRELVGK